ncbi:VOC family protein [Sorangium sp. So ce1078]|uniref:VOC family protein n=1 Tax=Sorangium sp. So ce1078 TaxID=3133329 RepID=UPI003F5EFE0A
MPFTFVCIDHVQLAMPPGQEARGVAFYRDVLGMEHVPKPEPLASRGGAWFRAGAVAVHLGVEHDFRPARKAHPGLVVKGIEDVAAALEAAGHAVRWSDELPEVRRFHTEDPFGNRIEIIDGG